MMNDHSLPGTPPLPLKTETVVTMKTVEPLTLHRVGAPTEHVEDCTRPTLVTSRTELGQLIERQSSVWYFTLARPYNQIPAEMFNIAYHRPH